jgi:hypothetical protein
MDAVYRRTERAEAEVNCVAHVGKVALLEAAGVNMVRAHCERLAPDGAEQYALIAVRCAIEMDHAIGRMTRGW